MEWPQSPESRPSKDLDEADEFESLGEADQLGSVCDWANLFKRLQLPVYTV